MNERIKELYKQSANQDYFPRDNAEVYMSAKDLEKFAELIVAECLDILDDEDDGGYEGRSVRIAAHRIKELFGVEE